MDFDNGPRSSETQDSKINVFNVVLSYVIEMNEYRSELFTTVEMTGVTPAAYKDFIRTFFKLFTLTQSMLPVELRAELDRYFRNDPKKTDGQGKKGIELSRKMQKELEDQRMITLYEETIVPPFVEPSDEAVPDEISGKKIHNSVTGKDYPVVTRASLVKDADKIRGLFNRQNPDKQTGETKK